MSLVIEHVQIYSPGSSLHGDTSIGIDAGQFVDPAQLSNSVVIDGRGWTLLPGLIDMRVNLREPGLEHKGTIASETRAALAGGVTTVVATPNTDPVIDTPADVRLVLERAQRAETCRVLPTGLITQGGDGHLLAEMMSLMEAGTVALSQGDAPFASTAIALNALKYAASLDIPLILDPTLADLRGGCAHSGRVATGLGLSTNSPLSETLAVRLLLELIEVTRCRVHFSRLTTARAVQYIANAKKRDLPVSCDVSLAHLLFDETAIANLNPNFHLTRPLRTRHDRDALRQGVIEGVIDAIVSDHAPHEPGAKLAPFPETEPGMSMVECTLSALYALDHDGLPFAHSLRAMTTSPAHLLGLDWLGQIEVGYTADCVLVDPTGQRVFDHAHWISEWENSPYFHGVGMGQIHGIWVEGNDRTDRVSIGIRDDSR